MSADGLGCVHGLWILGSDGKFLWSTLTNTLLIVRGRLRYGEEKRAHPYSQNVNDI